jgi:hypothetical protein
VYYFRLEGDQQPRQMTLGERGVVGFQLWPERWTSALGWRSSALEPPPTCGHPGGRLRGVPATTRPPFGSTLLAGLCRPCIQHRGQQRQRQSRGVVEVLLAARALDQGIPAYPLIAGLSPGTTT